MNLLGQDAEIQAADFLRHAGLKIAVRNWRCRQGELDLVAWEGETLVFVEVRKRASSRFGGAAASIDHGKRAKLLQSAQAYLQTLARIPPCRFDAICIDGRRLEWLKNCIDASV